MVSEKFIKSAVKERVKQIQGSVSKHLTHVKNLLLKASELYVTEPWSFSEVLFSVFLSRSVMTARHCTAAT